MSTFKRGDKVEASESYKREMLEGDWPDDVKARSPWSGHSFVVSKVVKGPYYNKNAHGYHEGGWVNDDAVYDERGVIFPASELKKSDASEEDVQPKKKSFWSW